MRRIAIAAIGLSLLAATARTPPIHFTHGSLPVTLENGETPRRYAPESMAGGVAIFETSDASPPGLSAAASAAGLDIEDNGNGSTLPLDGRLGGVSAELSDPALRESLLSGVSQGAPNIGKEKAQAGASGALDRAKAGGGSAMTQVILPRHKGVVERYFERPGRAKR